MSKRKAKPLPMTVGVGDRIGFASNTIDYEHGTQRSTDTCNAEAICPVNQHLGRITRSVSKTLLSDIKDTDTCKLANEKEYSKTLQQTAHKKRKVSAREPSNADSGQDGRRPCTVQQSEPQAAGASDLRNNIMAKGDIYKQVLNRTIVDLVRDMEPVHLLDEFKKRGVLNDITIRDITDICKTSDKNRKIIEHIQRNGDKSYHMFKECLASSKQHNLLEKLKCTETLLGYVTEHSPIDDTEVASETTNPETITLMHLQINARTVLPIYNRIRKPVLSLDSDCDRLLNTFGVTEEVKKPTRVKEESNVMHLSDEKVKSKIAFFSNNNQQNASLKEHMNHRITRLTNGIELVSEERYTDIDKMTVRSRHDMVPTFFVVSEDECAHLTDIIKTSSRDSIRFIVFLKQKGNDKRICEYVSKQFPQNILIAESNCENLFDTFDDLWERYIFNTVRVKTTVLTTILLDWEKHKYVTKANVNPTLCKESDGTFFMTKDIPSNVMANESDNIRATLENAKLLYEESEVPENERPTLPTRRRPIADEILLKLRAVQDVKAVFHDDEPDTLLVVIEKNQLRPAEETKRECKKMLEQHGITGYSIKLCSLVPLSEAGSPLYNKTGTLGCFALHNDTDLCALFAKHVLDLNRSEPQLICKGEAIGTVMEPVGDDFIAAAKISNGYKAKCELRLRDEDGVHKPCKLTDFEDHHVPDMRQVFIWGATTSPGYERLCSYDYTFDGRSIILLTGRIASSQRFSDPGDSGAIVCGSERRR